MIAKTLSLAALLVTLPALADDAIEKLDARVAEISKGRPVDSPAVAAILSRAFATQLGMENPFTVSTYSFEHGTRDDVRLARNDWDVQYGNPEGTLSVQMVVDDRSRLYDLGIVPLAAAPAADAAALGGEKPIVARKDHVYVAHTVDPDSDHWTRFRVLEIEPEKWIVFEWERLESSIPELRRLERMSLSALASGPIRLEVRSAWAGGNPHGVFLDGTATLGVDSVTRAPAAPLEVTQEDRARRGGIASCDGGLIPEDHVFVIESIEWTANLEPGAPGPLTFEYWLGPYRVAVHDSNDGEGRRHTIDGGARAESGDSSMGKFTGTVVLRPGEETRVACVARNGTIARATVTGRLVSSRGNRLPPLPVDISKRDAIEANEVLRQVDEGNEDIARSFAERGSADILAAFLEDALRFRTSDEDRGRIERALKLLRRP